jgi:hypothetical protein
LRDSDGSHVLSIAAGSNLTSNITLTLTTGTSSRTLDISASNVTISTAGAALIDDADASAQRTTLGLGTIATQNSNNVSITGGSVTGITDLAVADGGTGASDAATARTNLGIGTLGTQNANAVAITGGTIVANASGISIRDADASNVMTIAVGSNLTANTTLTLTTGATTNRTLDISATNVTISTAGAALIDDADAAAQRTTLGLGTVATQNSNNVSITDLALADGGTGASLSDPNANAVLGWNDTANTMRFFTAGTGISIDAATNTIASTVTAGGNYVMQAFTNTTPGGVTWTKPAGLKAIKVTVVGGGGGAATVPGVGPGGVVQYTRGGAGAGGAAIEYIPAPSIPGPVTVTVGVGGPATAPTAGGTSSFGTFCSATGGSAGAAGTPTGEGSVRGGAGGAGSGGTINFTGQSGGATLVYGSPTLFVLGSGGSSILGGGAQGLFQNENATAGLAYGGGAPGLSTPNTRTGAAGGQGIVIVEEFY